MLDTTITQEMTVNQAIQIAPATATVFKQLGIDSCCGGALQIEEAAKRHGVDIDTLMELLGRAASLAY